jgi:hypothetical protein
MLLDEMDREELRKYLDFFLRHYRVMDAFWYIYLEEAYGSDTANHINAKVWTRMGGLSARDIAKKFNITEKGLDGFLKAFAYYPWTVIVDYHIEQTPQEVIMSVSECPQQMARLKRNLGEYDCKEMHRGEFVTFAREIDPSIKVECIHAPLDPHPVERFCQWRFTTE